MNNKELRIENWIIRKSSGNYQQVREVLSSMVLLDNEPPLDVKKTMTVSLKSIEPIPLTPEILEKAGLNRTGNLARTASRKFYKIGNLIIESIADNRVAIYLDSQTEFVLIGYQDYLHQLQNLYFALTGEELEINL